MEIFYKNAQSLKEIEEPFRAVLDIIEGLYIAAPEGCHQLSYDLPDFMAVNCIACICKDIYDNPLRLPRVLKNYLDTIFRKGQRSNRFDFFCVPNEFEFVTILGGVYYVLAIERKLDDRRLSFIETFSHQIFPGCQPQFDMFKQATAEFCQDDTAASGHIDPYEAAMMAEVLAEVTGMTITNKKKQLAPIAALISGYSPSTMERKLCEGYSSQIRGNVAKMFKEMSDLSATFGMRQQNADGSDSNDS